MLSHGVNLVLLSAEKPMSEMMDSMRPGWHIEMALVMEGFIIRIPRKSLTVPWSSNMEVEDKALMSSSMVESS
jgi:hypothetical protein